MLSQSRDCTVHVQVVKFKTNFSKTTKSGLEIATDTVANATNISPLVTKHSGLVAILPTTFLCVDDE